MQSIKLHINNLGLIRDADIEITPFMVFSGESGLGKSYVAILCHYFFSVWLNNKRLSSYFESLRDRCFDFTNSSPDVSESGVALSITKLELEKWLAADAVNYLGFMLGFDGMTGSIDVILPSSLGNTIEFKYERELVGLNNEEDLYWKLSCNRLTYRFRQLGIQEESPYAYIFRNLIIAELFGMHTDLTKTFVLPPSRGSYFTEEISPKTGLFKTFIKGMKLLEESSEIHESTSQDSIKLFYSLIDGSVQKNGDKYTYRTSNNELPIVAAASSIREMAPLQLIVNKRDISKMALLIEEPEAHLHPLKQRLIADAIVSMAAGGACMQITTHSDYFLRRINDLIRLHIIKNRYQDSVAYHEFCEELEQNPDLTLDPNIISAYYLVRREDGSVIIKRQDTSTGVPFDTFREINGAPLANSSRLYEITFEDGI